MTSPNISIDYATSERRRSIAGALLTRRQILRERLVRIAGFAVVGMLVILGARS